MTAISRPRDPAASTAVVILGADAVLAARPATPVQLAHACLAAGYRSAIPATWGDELVAQECLAMLAAREPGPAICCACPLVARSVLAPEADLSRFAIQLASPPVATARYLRQLARDTLLHVTFVGGCPSGDDPAIDVHLTPAAFLAGLASRGIAPGEQPTTFDSVIPPDRRRHFSLPGGVPAPEALWRQPAGARRLVEVLDDDYATEVAEHLLSGEPVLVDLAPRLGCFCSGAAEGVAPRSARLLVASLEPPRSPGPVVDPAVNVPLHQPRLTTPAGTPVATASPPRGTATGDRPPCPTRLSGASSVVVGRPPQGSPLPPPRRTGETSAIDAARRSGAGSARMPSLTPALGVGRRTPVALSRVTLDHFPQARDRGGRLLPRAYLARRDSRPRLTPVPAPPGDPCPAARPTPATSPAATAVATPPVGTAYDALVADLTAIVSDEVERWRVRLGDAIAFWRAQGYETAVLERARALPRPPDVEGLLATYAAAVEHLRRLEELATSVYPEVAGAPVLRDPERVRAAESFVDRLFVRE